MFLTASTELVSSTTSVNLQSITAAPLRDAEWTLVLFLRTPKPPKKRFSPSAGQRGLYSVSAVTHCNTHAHKSTVHSNSAGPLHLFIPVSLTLHWHLSILMAPPTPHFPLHRLPSLVLQTSSHFFFWSHFPLMILLIQSIECVILSTGCVSLSVSAKGSFSLSFLFSSVHLRWPARISTRRGGSRVDTRARTVRANTFKKEKEIYTDVPCVDC